jgi:DNA excision repair protein ERCC-5
VSHFEPLRTAPGYAIFSPGTVAPDPDLRAYHGRMALASIAKRHAAPRKPPHRQRHASAVKATAQSVREPLFMDEDANLQVAIQQSLEQHDAEVLQRTIESSKDDALSREPSSGSELPLAESNQQDSASPADSDDGLYVPGPSRLDTALAFANTSPNKRSLAPLPPINSTSLLFGRPSLLLSENSDQIGTASEADFVGADDDASEDTMEEVIPVSREASVAGSASKASRNNYPHPSTSSIMSAADAMEVETATSRRRHTLIEKPAAATTVTISQQREPTPLSYVQEGLISTASIVRHESPSRQLNRSVDPPATSNGHVQGQPQDDSTLSVPEAPHPQSGRPATTQVTENVSEEVILSDLARSPSPTAGNLSEREISNYPALVVDDAPEEVILSDWARSPSPAAGNSTEREINQDEVAHWDAAQEMDVVAEEGDFAQFLSQMKGQDLEAARREIDNEIRDLNKQKKAAMRDSEDITQQMISQIMVESPSIADFVETPDVV